MNNPLKNNLLEFGPWSSLCKKNLGKIITFTPELQSRQTHLDKYASNITQFYTIFCVLILVHHLSNTL